MKKYWNLFANPFIRIAGMQALGWGIAGMVVSVFLCWATGYHYNGLLSYGPNPNQAWWSYLIDHLIVWLVPAIIFYLGGIALSRSHIRISDVLGTVLFAQLPLLVMNAIQFSPPMQALRHIGLNPTPEQVMELAQQPEMLYVGLLGLLMLPVLILMLVWMFRALQISCNLKGGRLWTIYLIGILAGDVICRILIGKLL